MRSLMLDQVGFPPDPELRRLMIHIGLSDDNMTLLAQEMVRVMRDTIDQMARPGRRKGWSPLGRFDRAQLRQLEAHLDRELTWKDIDSIASSAAGTAKTATKRERLWNAYLEIHKEREALRRLLTRDKSA